MSLKFVRKHTEAVVPSRAHPSDVGLDLVAIKKHKVFPYKNAFSCPSKVIPPTWGVLMILYLFFLYKFKIGESSIFENSDSKTSVA